MFPSAANLGLKPVTWRPLLQSVEIRPSTASNWRQVDLVLPIADFVTNVQAIETEDETVKVSDAESTTNVTEIKLIISLLCRLIR